MDDLDQAYNQSRRSNRTHVIAQINRQTFCVLIIYLYLPLTLNLKTRQRSP